VAKKLGYSGFPTLKEDFYSWSREQEGEYGYRGVTSHDGVGEVVEKIFAATVDAINDTLKVLDEYEYQRTLEAILASNKILFCGVGDGALVAIEAYQRFVRIGMHCEASEDPDMQLIMSSHLKKGDLLFAISHSGKSKSVVNAVKEAKKSEATVVAVTNYPFSPLAKRADIILLTAAFSQHVTGEVISKRVAELCIIESLYVNYMILKGESVLKQLTRANEAVQVNKI
jgi:DNA-binding MurR/RpiR family transcriptional regulator